MGLVLKCTFQAKRSTKNGRIDFKTVLNDHIGNLSFLLVLANQKIISFLYLWVVREGISV